MPTKPTNQISRSGHTAGRMDLFLRFPGLYGAAPENKNRPRALLSARQCRRRSGWERTDGGREGAERTGGIRRAAEHWPPVVAWGPGRMADDGARRVSSCRCPCLPCAPAAGGCNLQHQASSAPCHLAPVHLLMAREHFDTVRSTALTCSVKKKKIVQ
jgi:hypothetical protein